MNKSQFISELSGKKILSVSFTLVCLLVIQSSLAMESENSQLKELGREKTIRLVAQNWIQIGVKQYDKCFFDACEQSFLRAQEYKEYLSALERKQLNEYFEKIRIAKLERNLLFCHINSAEKLVSEGKIIRSMAHLENAQNNKFLTEPEHKEITKKLENLSKQLNENKNKANKFYKYNVELYRNGQLKKAREGFIKLADCGICSAPSGKTPEDYLLKIDSVLEPKVQPAPIIPERPAQSTQKVTPTTTEDTFPDIMQNIEAQKTTAEQDKSEFVDIAKPDVGNNINNDSVVEKENIRQSYAIAVTKDAVNKAQCYAAEGKFYKAKEAVEAANLTINKNRLYLSDELVRQYQIELKQLVLEINDGRTRWLGNGENKNPWEL